MGGVRPAISDARRQRSRRASLRPPGSSAACISPTTSSSPAPPAHLRKTWCNTPLERLDTEIERRSPVFGIGPNELGAIRRLPRSSPKRTTTPPSLAPTSRGSRWRHSIDHVKPSTVGSGPRSERTTWRGYSYPTPSCPISNNAINQTPELNAPPIRPSASAPLRSTSSYNSLPTSRAVPLRDEHPTSNY